jgi:hypothetical protein
VESFFLFDSNSKRRPMMDLRKGTPLEQIPAGIDDTVVVNGWGAWYAAAAA